MHHQHVSIRTAHDEQEVHSVGESLPEGSSHSVADTSCFNFYKSRSAPSEDQPT